MRALAQFGAACVLATQCIAPALAVRYEAEDIRTLIVAGNPQLLKEIRAINNLGDVVGINNSNSATLVRPYSLKDPFRTGIYRNANGAPIDSQYYIGLPAPVIAPPDTPVASSVAVDLTSAKQSAKDAITIVGSYVDTAGLVHAVYWDEDASVVSANPVYIVHKLPPWKPETVAAGVADIEAEAVAISNNGVIVGTSYDAAKNPRPVVWSKVTRTANGKDTTDFEAIDLRTEGTTAPAKVVGIEKNGTDIVGMAKRPDSSIWDPVLWNRHEKPAGYFTIPLPVPLSAAQDNVSNNDYVAPTQRFPLGATPTAFGGTAAGWFEQEENGVAATKPITWFSLSRTYQDKEAHPAVYRAFTLGTLNGTDGKILAINNLGQSNDLYVGESGNRAMAISNTCGPEDVNRLLATPFNDGTVLQRITAVAQGIFPAMMIGESVSGAEKRAYLIRPTTFSVDLGATIVGDHEHIKVGQAHAYTVTVTNNSPIETTRNNSATCTTIRVEAAIFDAANANTKRGGLTFLAAKSDQATCQISEVSVLCDVPYIEPGQSVTIKIEGQARPLLADRAVKTTVTVTPSEAESAPDNNTASVLLAVDREACFIATAAYGSYLDPHVASLREFRDTYLKSTWAGRQLVDGYYAVSPGMAEYLLDNPSLKPWVRAGLAPLVVTVEHPRESLAAILLGAFVYWRMRQRRQNRIKS